MNASTVFANGRKSAMPLSTPFHGSIHAWTGYEQAAGAAGNDGFQPRLKLSLLAHAGIPGCRKTFLSEKKL